MDRNVEWKSFNIKYINEKLYFIDHINNTFSMFDLKTGRSSVLYCFDDEKMWRRYGDFLAYKDKFIFAPECASQIVVLDLHERKNTYIPIDRNRVKCEGDNICFSGIIIRGSQVFLFPFESNCIVVLDLDNYGIEYIDIVHNSSEKIGFAKVIDCSNGKCYIPFLFENKILEFSMDTKRSVLYSIKKDSIGFASGCWDGNNVWLADLFHSKIYKWNSKNENILSFYNEFANDKLEQGFSVIMYNNCKIILFPLKGDIIYVFDIQKCIFKKKYKIKGVLDNSRTILGMCHMYDMVFAAYLNANNKLIICDLETNSAEETITQYSLEESNYIRKKYISRFRREGVVSEVNIFNAEDYIYGLMYGLFE